MHTAYRKQINKSKFVRILNDPRTEFCTFSKGIYKPVNKKSLMVRKMKRLYELSEITNQPSSSIKLVLGDFMYYKWGDRYWRRSVVAKKVYFLSGGLRSNAKA